MTRILALQKLAASDTDLVGESTQSICCNGSTQSNENCCNGGTHTTAPVTQ